MDETVFKDALAAIIEGDGGDNEKKVVKEWMRELDKEEATLKRQLDKNKRDFIKKRDTLISRLNQLKSDVKYLKSILRKD